MTNAHILIGLIIAAAAPLRAQITVLATNVNSSVTTAYGNVGVPVGPIVNGQSYSLGGPIASGTDSARLAFGLQTVASATVRYTFSAACSSGGHFDQGCYCVIGHSAGAGGATRLTVSSAQPMIATMAIHHSVLASSYRVYASVDVGAEGRSDFFAPFGSGSISQVLRVELGPDPVAIDVRLDATAYTPGFMIAGADLQIDLTPLILVASGHGQVVPSGEPFPQPVTVRVLDAAGAPIAAAPVAFSVVGPATLSAPNAVTDANGFASVTATALPAGGLVTVTAGTPSALGDLVHVSMFSRHLGAVRTPNSLDLAVTNAPVGTPGPVPMVLAIAPAGITPLQTFLGPICTNPLDPATIVFEDSLGLFGFVSLSGAGATGSPDLARSYPLASGVFAGVVVWLQGVGFDPDRGFFRTNCQQIVL